MVTTKQRYTFEDWLELPDDGRRYELLNGDLVEMAPPTANHALLVSALDRWFGRAEAAGHGSGIVGPVAVLLDAAMRRENAPEPDVLFVRRGREQIITAEAVEGVPDLVIEILSPSNRKDDLPGGEKWKLYRSFGVPSYWTVDPATRTITQYERHAGQLVETGRLGLGEELVSPLFPGITLPVAELFQSLRESRR